jgi:hypothetical protein
LADEAVAHLFFGLRVGREGSPQGEVFGAVQRTAGAACKPSSEHCGRDMADCVAEYQTTARQQRREHGLGGVHASPEFFVKSLNKFVVAAPCILLDARCTTLVKRLT